MSNMLGGYGIDQYVRAWEDVPTQLIIYPDQYHTLTRPSFQLDKRKRYLEWYARYVKAGAASPVASDE